MTRQYVLRRTNAGYAGAISEGHRIVRTLLASDFRDAKMWGAGCEPEGSQGPCSRFCSLMKVYFEKQPVDFKPLPYAYESGTDFQVRVWEAVRKIPPGKPMTYGDVGRLLGSRTLARAVGGALRRNPLPMIVPCHRVIATNGNSGGFSAAGGKPFKEYLLALERELCAN